MTDQEFKEQLIIAIAPEVVKAVLPMELKSSRVDYNDIAFTISFMIEKIVEKTKIN